MIIIIIGICIQDLNCDGSLFHDKLIYSKSDYVSYDKMPRSLINWPCTINIKCWNCRTLFATFPVPIPIRCDNNIINKGIACSVDCAKTYILTYKDPEINQKEIKKHLHLLIRACQELNINISEMKEKQHFYFGEGFGY